MEIRQIPPIVDPTQKVDYQSALVPTNYKCHNCGVIGVKLWREQTASLNLLSLLCCKCSGEEQEKDVKNIDDQGRVEPETHGRRRYQIGCRIPAIPTEDNDSYWWHSVFPEDGAQWWRRLPNTI
jgi:hypothetical protein